MVGFGIYIVLVNQSFLSELRVRFMLFSVLLILREFVTNHIYCVLFPLQE